jgi:hypothetical protein
MVHGRVAWTVVCVRAVVFASVAAGSLCGISGQDQSPDDFPYSRVRTESMALRRLLNEGIEKSPTFREVVTTINKTNGLVYLYEGRCARTFKACLLLQIQSAGPNRLLRIQVDTRERSDVVVIGSIGHELRHAFEILEDPRVTTPEHMVGVWFRGLKFSNERFETNEAIEIGIRIREELWRIPRK